MPTANCFMKTADFWKNYRKSKRFLKKYEFVTNLLFFYQKWNYVNQNQKKRAASPFFMCEKINYANNFKKMLTRL